MHTLVYSVGDSDVDITFATMILLRSAVHVSKHNSDESGVSGSYEGYL